MSDTFDFVGYYVTTMKWAVFPAPPGEKKSYLSAEHSDGRRWGATHNLDEARRIFDKYTDANIGIPTGAISNVFVVEADTLDGHAVDGIASLAALQVAHGVFPPTLQAESPSGSVHYYFLHPGFDVKSSASALAPGVDVRGDRGMVIAPPSVRLGRGAYRWLNGLAPATAPAWLLAMVASTKKTVVMGEAKDAPLGLRPTEGTQAAQVLKLACDSVVGAEIGTRNNNLNTQAYVVGRYVGNGEIGMDVAAADLLAACRNGAYDNEAECVGTIRSGLTAGVKEPAQSSSEMFGNVPAITAPSVVPGLPTYDMAASIGPLPDHPELKMQEANALSKFWAHLPSGKIIYEGTRELWSPGSLDKHLGKVKIAMTSGGQGMLATTWLSQHRAVQSMGWSPGDPMIIEGKVLTNDGWLYSHGDKTFNRYVPPDIEHVEGDVSKWLNHVRWVYPDEATHIVKWLAHRVQHPGVKINHCLDFLGKQGVGKDTIVAPVIAAIGGQNFKQVAAKAFFKTEWNDFLQSVILRINEIHDLGGESRYGFYDATKDVTTSPPETHRINTKGVPQYAAVNVCGVIMTSNHNDALYIPADDRRHYVCLSNRDREELPPGYFEDMHAWFENGGSAAVAHYLANLDLSDFGAKAPPPKTAGWHMLVAAGLAPESGDLTDVIEAMDKPAALTLQTVRSCTPFGSHLRMAFEDPKLSKAIPKRLVECGYVAVPNPEAHKSGGRWPMAGIKVTIYARQDISETERLAAARALSASPPALPLLPPVPG